MVKLKDLLSSRKDSELRTLYENVLNNDTIEIEPLNELGTLELITPLTNPEYKNRAAHIGAAFTNLMKLTPLAVNSYDNEPEKETFTNIKKDYRHYDEYNEHVETKLATIIEYAWIAELFEETYIMLEDLFKPIDEKKYKVTAANLIKLSNNLVWTETFYSTGFFPKDLEAMRGNTELFLNEEISKLFAIYAETTEDETVTNRLPRMIEDKELILPDYTITGEALQIIKTGETKPTKAAINKELEYAKILAQFDDKIKEVQIYYLRYNERLDFKVNRRGVLID